MVSHTCLLCYWLYLQDADKKGLSKISEEVKQLASKAKENTLKPQDYEVIEVMLMPIVPWKVIWYWRGFSADSLCREVHLQFLTWEGHLASNSSVPSSIHLSQAFLQLDPVRMLLGSSDLINFLSVVFYLHTWYFVFYFYSREAGHTWFGTWRI